MKDFMEYYKQNPFDLEVRKELLESNDEDVLIYLLKQNPFDTEARKHLLEKRGKRGLEFLYSLNPLDIPVVGAMIQSNDQSLIKKILKDDPFNIQAKKALLNLLKEKNLDEDMKERKITLEANMGLRKGDIIEITGGWIMGNEIRANTIINQSSGEEITIPRGMMVDPPKEINPPIRGVVDKIHTTGNNSKKFTLKQDSGKEIISSEEYDFFICHASEDKDEFVKPLADALKKHGFKVWYDGFIIGWGDDLRPKIDEGLIKSKYGLVVLSKNFFKKKKWTEHELSSLYSKESVGNKVILPIWHKITKKDVSKYSLHLADRISLPSDNISNIIRECKKLINQ